MTKLFYDPSKIPGDLLKKCHTSQLKAGNRRAFLKILRAPVRYREEEFKNLSMPVQLIWSQQLGEQPFSKALENLEVNILEEVGNLPNIEKPKESVALALNFFKGE